MKNFLLHTCCAPCASYIIEELKNRDFNVAVFFYNPNIFPETEYQIRRDEIKNYCDKNQIQFLYFSPLEGESKRGNYSEQHKEWLQKISRDRPVTCPEKEPEGGLRCEKCYQIRLEKTAEFAVKNNFQFFDSTLSISPHKNFEKIKNIGNKLAEKFNLNFYAQDWKKQNGFKKSCELSHKHNFYRQNYCGCEFSKK